MAKISVEIVDTFCYLYVSLIMIPSKATCPKEGSKLVLASLPTFVTGRVAAALPQAPS